MYHFIIICEFKLELQSGNENLGRDLCDLDLWPWPFAWTSLLSLVITPENFMMIGWWEHSQKGVTDRRTDGRTDRRTDGRTDWTIHRAAWSQLKKWRHPISWLVIGDSNSTSVHSYSRYLTSSLDWNKAIDCNNKPTRKDSDRKEYKESNLE